MKEQDWLFPHVFRKTGWWIVAALGTFLLALQTDAGQQYFYGNQDRNTKMFVVMDHTDAIVNMLIIGFAIGLLLIAFSREKQEDEMIRKLRWQALQWSVYINYLVLILCALAFYSLDFFNVLIVNMYTVLAVFIVIFRWTLRQMNKEALS